MISLLTILLALQPFNTILEYPGDQAGKGSAVTSFGCIAAGTTALDPSGTTQIITAAFDNAGTFLWCDSMYFGTSSEVYSLQNCDDLIIYTGYSSNPSTSEDALAYSVDLTCQRQWTFELKLDLQERFTSAAAGADGSFLCAGSTNSQGAGGNDVLLVNLDENGEQNWIRTYGTAGEEAVYHAAACSDGGYILACQAMDWGAGNGDYWIIRTDSSGDTLWTGTYGGPEFDYPWRVIENGDFFYVAGSTLSYGEGSYDWWILKLDANGNLIWDRSWGYGNTDTCMALSAWGAGVIAAGHSEPVQGSFYATAVKLDENGSITDHWQYAPGMFRSVTETPEGNWLFGGTTWSTSGNLWALCTDPGGEAPELGIEQDAVSEGIRIGMNPVSTTLPLDLSSGVTDVVITDLTGRAVLVLGSISRGPLSVDVSELPAGLYTVQADGNLPPARFVILR